MAELRKREKKITFNSSDQDLENIDLIKKKINEIAGGKINTSIVISMALSNYARTFKKEN